MSDEDKCQICDGTGKVLWVCPTCENGLPLDKNGKPLPYCPDCMGAWSGLIVCSFCGGTGKV